MRKGFLWICAAALVFLSACGASSQTSGAALQSESISDGEYSADYDSVRQAFPVLLARDYEAYYIVFYGGIEQDYADSADGYVHVAASSGFASLDDLRVWLEKTYTAEGASEILASEDAEGKPLFTEKDGKLYRSLTGAGAGGLSDYDESTARYAPNGDDECVCYVTDASGAEIAMTAKKENGCWRLTAPRIWTAAQTGGDGGAETAGQVAADFLRALTDSDIDAIERCTGSEAGTYASWKGIAVTRAEVAETVEENDAEASYLVELEVKNAFGLLMPGKTRYRLIVRTAACAGEASARPAVVYFQPESAAPYNYRSVTEQTDVACNQAMRYLALYGAKEFSAASELDAGTVTEFTACLLTQESSQQAFTEQQMADGAERYFGLKDFAPDASYYSASAGGYIMPGRAGSGQEYEMEASKTKNGRTTVNVNFYADRLQTQGLKTLVFTFKANADGSFAFVSLVSA